jgi:hypothetical protein
VNINTSTASYDYINQNKNEFNAINKIDAVYKKLRMYRRGSEFSVPYILSVCIDTFEQINKERQQ